MSIHQQERRKHNNTPYRAPRNHNTYRNKSNTSRNIGKAVLATVLPLVLYNVGRDQGQRPQEPGFSIDPITWVATPISDFVEDLIPTQPKLPDISTPSGIKQARQGMKDGDLTSVVAIPNSQYDINL